jgi:EmrB/QacA subfamily drug resistance transporter
MIKIKENRWLLISIVIGSFFNSFMSSSLNIAMPVIDIEYGIGVDKVAWITKSFLLAAAIGLLLSGWLADNFGRRKIFLIGNVVFGLISFIIIFLQNFYLIVIFRFLQGLGSSMIMASAPALIASAFDNNKRGFVLGIQTTFTYIGLLLAPLLGGILTQYFGWESLFLFNFLFTLVALIIILVFVKSEWKNEEKSKFDFYGYSLFVVVVIGIVLALEWMNWNSLIALGISFLFGYGFIIYELQYPQPFISISFIRSNKFFTNSILAALINYATTFAISYILSIYLQNVRGMKPMQAGLILSFQPLMMVLFSAYFGHLSDKHNPGKIASYGMAIISIALLLIGLLINETMPIFILAILLAVLGFGFSLFSSPNTNAVMSSINKNAYGFASAFLAFSRLFGQFISMGLASSLILLVNTRNLNIFHFHSLVLSTKIIFIIFAIFSAYGVYLSIQRIKKN